MWRFWFFTAMIAGLILGSTCWTVWRCSRPASVSAAAEGDSSVTVPESLRQIQELRDSELVTAKLKVHDAASAFLNTLQSFQDDVARYRTQYQRWSIDNPQLAVIDATIPAPLPIDFEAHLLRIREAKEDFEQSLHVFETDVNRIKYRFFSELQALEGPDDHSGVEFPVPKLDADRLVVQAIAVLANMPQVLESIEESYSKSFGGPES